MKVALVAAYNELVNPLTTARIDRPVVQPADICVPFDRPVVQPAGIYVPPVYQGRRYDHSVELLSGSKCVFALAILSDGVTCVTSILTQQFIALQFWNLTTFECVDAWNTYIGLVFKRRYGIKLAVLSDDRIVNTSFNILRPGKINIYNRRTKRKVARLRGHTDDILQLLVLNDDRIVSASRDKTVRIWNPNSGACLHILSGHTNAVTVVSSFADGRIVTGSNDKTIRIWNSESGVCERVVQTVDVVVHLMTLRDGRLLWSNPTHPLCVYDTTSELRTIVGTKRDIGVRNVVELLQDGQIIAFGWNNKFRIIDLATPTMTCLQTSTETFSDVKNLLFLADGRLLSSQGSFQNESIVVWD